MHKVASLLFRAMAIKEKHMSCAPVEGAERARAIHLGWPQAGNALA